MVLSHSVWARKVFIANPPVATGIVRASRLGHKAIRSSDRQIRKGCAQNDDAAQFLSRATRRGLRPVQPVVHVLLHLVFGVAIAGLYLALKLFAVAIDLGKVIVGKLTPLFLHLARELLPICLERDPNS